MRMDKEMVLMVCDSVLGLLSYTAPESIKDKIDISVEKIEFIKDSVAKLPSEEEKTK